MAKLIEGGAELAALVKSLETRSIGSMSSAGLIAAGIDVAQDRCLMVDHRRLA